MRKSRFRERNAKETGRCESPRVCGRDVIASFKLNRHPDVNIFENLPVAVVVPHPAPFSSEPFTLIQEISRAFSKHIL